MPPNPCVVLVLFDSETVIFLNMMSASAVVACDKIVFLYMVDMYLMVFAMLSEYLMIALLIHWSIIAVTVTDGIESKQCIEQLIR